MGILPTRQTVKSFACGTYICLYVYMYVYNCMLLKVLYIVPAVLELTVYVDQTGPKPR